MNEFILPNGITIDGVLYNRAHLEELTGKQQNYLVNTKYKSPVDHIERLLGDLLVDVRDSNQNSILNHVTKQHLVMKMLQIEDISFLLIKLREISFGEKYFFEKVECSHCKAKNTARLNLASLEIIKPENAPIPEGGHVLPRAGLKIEYKPLNLSELASYGSDSERLLNNHITEACVSLLSKLGNESVTAQTVESLKAKDTQYIIDNAPKYNYLDNKLTHQCTSCKRDFDFELGELSADFFAPSRT